MLSSSYSLCACIIPQQIPMLLPPTFVFVFFVEIVMDILLGNERIAGVGGTEKERERERRNVLHVPKYHSFPDIKKRGSHGEQ